MKCYKCKAENSYTRWKGEDEILGVRFAAEGLRCRECGEVLYAADEVKRQEKLVADAIAERGVHTGAELRWLRKQSGLAAKELASLLDVTAETVSKWENDRRPITRLAAFAVNQLYRHPRKVRQLLDASGAPA